MNTYTQIKAAILAASIHDGSARHHRRHATRKWLLAFLLGAITTHALGCSAATPEPDYWVGPVGVHIASGVPGWVGGAQFDQDLKDITAEVEAVAGLTVRPVTVSFVPGRLSCGPALAAGCYRGWIEISTGWTHEWSHSRQVYFDFLPQCLWETALPHELLHHISGLSDTEEFKSLFATLSMHPCKEG